MPAWRVYQFAFAQARARARIGAMPAEGDWQHVVQARDVDDMVRRLRECGLQRWVASLPRAPAPALIETTLHQCLERVFAEVCGWLPRRWQTLTPWLRRGPAVAQVDALLRSPTYAVPAGGDPVLRALAALPIEQRAAALGATGYGRFVATPGVRPLAAWLDEFEQACPPLEGREAYLVARLRSLLETHAVKVKAVRAQAREGLAHPHVRGQWGLREELEKGLRGLLGGDPFNACLLLVYALLECLLFERCRGLLLARVHGWPEAGVV